MVGNKVCKKCGKQEVMLLKQNPQTKTFLCKNCGNIMEGENEQML